MERRTTLAHGVLVLKGALVGQKMNWGAFKESYMTLESNNVPLVSAGGCKM